MFLDILWRCIWLVCSFLAVGLFGLALVVKLGSVDWEGPVLGASNPILLVTALRKFWHAYGVTLLAQLGLLLLILSGFWIALEALFRGGRKGFWVYLGTSVGRLSLLAAAVALLGMLALRDDTGGALLIGAVTILGLWFLVSLLETAIRKDALVVIAVDFPKLLAVFGTLMAAEVFLAVVLWGSAVAALRSPSSSSASGIALAIIGVVVPFWMLLHSYLVAVRFSAIEIMSGCECKPGRAQPGIE